MGILDNLAGFGSGASTVIASLVIPIFVIAICGGFVLFVWAARTGKIDVPHITDYPIKALIKRRRMGGVVWDTTESLRKFETPIGVPAYKFKNSKEIIPRARIESILPSIGSPVVLLEEVAAGEYYPLVESESVGDKLDVNGKVVLDDKGAPIQVAKTALSARITPEVSTWVAYLLRYFNEHHKVESWLERLLPVLIVMSVALGCVIIIYSTNQSSVPMAKAIAAMASSVSDLANATAANAAAIHGPVIPTPYAP